jgi:hypothetical protein
MTRADSSARLSEWYDTHNLIWQVLHQGRYKLVYNTRFCIAEGLYWGRSHYLDVWMSAHQGADDTVEKLVSTNFYSYSSFVIFILTQCSTWSIFRGAEENSQDGGRRPHVGALQHPWCVCCGWGYFAWKVREGFDTFSIKYCQFIIVTFIAFLL